MGELQEIRVRLALLGPDGSGKTTALASHHEATPAEQRGPLTRIEGSGGRTIYYDHAEFHMGKVGALPIYVDVYALPGNPDAQLARRIILSGCNGYVFVADSRGYSLNTTREAFQELLEYLADRKRTPETAALVALLTRDDKHQSGSNRVELTLRKHLTKDRILRVGEHNTQRIGEALKKAAALALSREKEELEARRAGKPPPRVRMPHDLAEDVKLAHEIYLRAAGIAGPSFSPHSDEFLGKVFLELGATSAPDLEEATRLKAQALELKLAVTLEEILLKREMIDRELIPRARRIRNCVEVIHEEVLYGRIANELEVVSFPRVKRALTLQVKRHFQHSLDHLLSRAGQVDRLSRRRVLARLVALHQGELIRDDQSQQQAAPSHATPQAAWHTRPPKRNKLTLFGEVAVNLGLVTEDQAKECVLEQRALKREGTRRFIGELMKAKGYLSDDEIPLICKALEEKIADDRIDGYHIIRSLGRGNMALVFAARQINLDRIVALKILDPKLLFDSDFIERFIQEAQAAARLNHPNMVQAYDVGSCDDLHYFAMEYVDGVTVKDLIEDQGYIDEDTAIDIIVQTARALDHASRHNLVHRDVKPGNVMVNRDGVAKLCDLGLAKRTDQASGEESMILGSPYYISPEQIAGRADIDVRADIYSLGATMFHMLTGRPPFGGPTPEEVCLKHLNDPVPDPTILSSSVTQRVTPILFRMLAKERDQRYGSAADVVRDLLSVRPDAGSDPRQQDLAERINSYYPITRRWQHER